MSGRRRTCHAVTAVFAAALAAPATALAAPTLTWDAACYPEGAGMRFAGSGWTPGGEVAVFFSANGKIGTFVERADTAGNIAGGVDAPKLSQFDSEGPRLEFLWTANDQTRQAVDPAHPDGLAAGSVFVSIFDVMVRPWTTVGAATGRPRRTTTVTATGFDIFGRALYAHYLLGGRVVRSVRVGALSGVCGDLRRRMRQFPFRPVRPGTYRVVFSASATYDPDRASITYRQVRVRPRDRVR